MITFDNIIGFQLQSLHFGDQRLNARCLSSFQKMESMGFAKSFPHIFQDKHELKAFYSLMNNKKVTPKRFNAGYLNGLLNYFESSAEHEDTQEVNNDYLFNYQDTTFGKYHDRKVELGYLEIKSNNGLVIHSGVLTDANYIPIGISHQEHIIRPIGEFGKRQKRKQLSFEEKESYKWTRGIDWAVEFNQTIATPVVQVADRESDIAEFFNYAFSAEQYFIVRARHNRKVNGTQKRLWEYMSQQPIELTQQRKLLNTKGESFTANCSIRSATILLKQIDKPVGIVLLQVQDPPTDMQETQWLLLTNLPLEQQEMSLRVVDAYTKRWRTTEDFHKCLKTGCGIEQRQFTNPEALINVICLMSLAAIRLLRMRHLSQTQPNAELDSILNEEEIQMAQVLAPQFLKPIDLKYCKNNTVLWWTLLLGRLGGHQGISTKGLPGWITLSRGWEFFQHLLKGFLLAKNISNFSP